MDAIGYFGVRLRELRAKAGLTQAELAAKSGLHRQMIARFELGTRGPSWESAVALAAALGVSVQEFVGPMVPRRRKGKKK
jgi:transcriptional regulator with XRE-family HTH domain